jgi:hypothetical protein
MARRDASRVSCSDRLSPAFIHRSPSSAMNAPSLLPQSAEMPTIRAAVDAQGGCCWEVCDARGCRQDRCRGRLEAWLREGTCSA